MRLKRRTRAGLSLTLGVLVGLGLVTLPGAIAPSTQTSTTSGSNPRVTPSFMSGQPGTGSNQPTGASAPITPVSLLILVGLVLFPAIALSYLAKAWTMKRAKAGLRE